MLKRSFLFLILGLSLGSCSKKDDSALKLTLGTSRFILIDAKASSCKGAQQSPRAEDINSLYMTIGKVKVSWVPPSTEHRLRLIYIKVYPKSGGLSSDVPKTIAGQDLICLESGNPDQLEVVYDSTQTDIEFTWPLVLGDFAPVDATKRSRFAGSAQFLVYGLIQKDGDQDIPVTGRGSIDFQFDGIF